MSAGGDRLDRLARCLVRPEQPVLRRMRIPATRARTTGDAAREPRFSRRSALGLGVLGAFSVSMGLWKAPTANAQSLSREECIALCLDSTDAILERRLESCADVFEPNATYQRGWARFRTLFRAGPLSWVWDTSKMLRADNCYREARNMVQELRNQCFQACQDNCPRRLQSATTSHQACEYRPPRNPPPPKIPPPPPISPPSSQPSNCSTLAPPGAVCCLLPSGDEVPCYTGCAKDGSGCCTSVVGCG